jgi:hypothetical protein
MNNKSNHQNHNNNMFQQPYPVFIPQHNKYTTINNFCSTCNSNVPNMPNKTQHVPNVPNKTQSNTSNTSILSPRESRIKKIIIHRPPMDDKQEQAASDEVMMNQLLGSIFGSTVAGTVMKPDKHMHVPTAQNAKLQPRIQPEVEIVPIDRSRLKFIKEVPKTLDDLIMLCSKIRDKVYDSTEYYNIELDKLLIMEPALLKLQRMIGLTDVKMRIVDIILYYLQRLDVKNYDMLHTIIDGAPGTGKTEIAHIYCQILSCMGVLSKGTFHTAKKHDLIGSYLGHTAAKTAKLLEECRGGVLFIDEIYSFGNADGKDGKDIYVKECVDLIMEFMSENKSDFVLVVAGYKMDIQRFFLTMNDGLERRFPIHLAIGTYTALEMRDIFFKKVADLKWAITPNAIDTVFFEKERDYFKFFGGDMETLLSKCKYSHSRNLLADHSKIHRLLTMDDIRDGFELFKKNPEIAARKDMNIMQHLYN